jgi:hypothetical protein
MAPRPPSLHLQELYRREKPDGLSDRAQRPLYQNNKIIPIVFL